MAEPTPVVLPPPLRFPDDIASLSPALLRDLYRTMLRIRMLQLRIERDYPRDEMRTPVHLCLGQEAVAAGVCAALRQDDFVFSNYRGHGHFLAKGGDLPALMAELYGRETGCCRGRGGSMHLADPGHGLPGATAIVGGGIPAAVGAALAFSLQQQSRVAVVFFGDGAADEGVLYESVNFAVLKQLPVMFVCENNFYAVCSPAAQRHGPAGIAGRFTGWGIPARCLDGNNVIDVYAGAQAAVAAARDGGGPAFLECQVYRWRGHAGPGADTELGYRSAAELAAWQQCCPVDNFAKYLLAHGVLSESSRADVAAEIEAELVAADSAARQAVHPSPAGLAQYVFADDGQ